MIYYDIVNERVWNVKALLSKNNFWFSWWYVNIPQFLFLKHIFLGLHIILL